MDIIGDRTLRQVWDGLAQRHGAKTALVFESTSGETSEYTYAELNGEINRAANLFLGLGVEKGDRVAVQLHNSPEFLAVWFGLAKIGAIMVPINVHYLHGESLYILQKCAPRFIVAEERFAHQYEKMMEEKTVALEGILIAREPVGREFPGAENFSRLLREQSAELERVVPLSSSDTAEILFTSGTTSNPKGVVITHYNQVFAGHYTAWQCNLREDDRFMTMMPSCHIDFQCTAAMPTFTIGATFILLEKYSARRFWRQVCLHRATVTECIPLMIRTLMLQPQQVWEKDHCLREVMFFLNISEAEKDAFIERFNVRLFTSYGMTETIVGILGDCPGAERRWPSIGQTGLCYEARIADEAGNEAAPGVLGEILIKGEPGRTIFREYYEEPEATARTLTSGGWLHTGDKGYMDEDGYFYFVDRKQNLIKRSGENISSTEIENFLVTHPKIVDAAVVGIPDDICDEAVKAFIVVKEGETLTVEDVFDYCTEHIAKFKVPSSIEIRTDFPRTCTGKVRKNVLRDEAVAACAASRDAQGNVLVN
ncbi:crotonobetaine/carnitine-CoA ligase [Pseudodesulfovibrio tunisiensis]|uniref:crotonobetaine/carnitine-CoA ligase n=1 Tax=Pseudodesulfovibrio tunisiensis TaxID=463192 RepID=UPI001FB2053A|nr:crotonobetaine/carnitine-CoA ligase [Pseudodesulfovibrio tunisiensis]